MRLIDADAFIRRLREACEDKATRMIVDKIGVFVETEATFHPVDAEPIKHGKWKKTGQSFVKPNRFRNYCCSVCGYDIEKTKYKYCPNCGALMEAKNDSAEEC